MASILRVNTLTDASSNNSVTLETVSQGSLKAWLTVNQDGTMAAFLTVLTLPQYQMTEQEKQMLHIQIKYVFC